MNHHRDGQQRHKITPGKLNYWPNRETIIPPAKASEGGYVDYPEKIIAMKQRLHSVKFSEHISQAQTFWNSMSEIEKSHIIAALGFELDHCDEPIVYNRMVERLCDISLELAQSVAEKVGGR
jgi:catalase